MKRKILYFLFVLLSFCLVGLTETPASREIRVGAYENAPKIYTGSDGTVTGFWPTLLNEIALKENWKIVWVHCAWEECLQKLEKGEIDIMPDVGLTASRQQTLAFSNEVVLTSWARLYVPQGSTIQTILDLEGKKVAGLEGSLNFDGPEGIKVLAKNFGVNATFINKESYQEVFQAIQSHEADAGVTNKDFGDVNERAFQLERTPIILQPTQLFFAFPKDSGETPYLIQTIDAQIHSMKEEHNSIYYQALDKFFGQSSAAAIPAWAIYAMFSAAVFIVFLIAAILFSRFQISRQTEKLRTSEARYRALFENNPDQILWMDSQANLQDFHINGNKNLLHHPTENIGKKISTCLPKSIGKTMTAAIEKAISTHEMQLFEFDLNQKGESKNYETRIVINENNEVIAFIRDITEQKQAENELIKSEQRYLTLTQTVPVGIFHTDASGKTTFVNDAWSKISGMTEESALGDGWLKGVHPDDQGTLSANWNQASNEHIKSFADYRFVHQDGSITWVMGQAVPELDAKNNVVGYVGTITDITERKKIEDLQAAVIRAESADKLKSAFLATMSHELRTPLNSIIGFTGILLQKLVGPLSAEQEKQLRMVQGSAHHLLDLINDVLDISKIEADQIVLSFSDFDLGNAIKKSLEKIKPQAEKKGLQVIANVDPEKIEIHSDQRRVEQILINLLNNAVKFTDKGQVVLNARVEDDWVITSVCDTGIGISNENIKTLFMPFRQVDMGLTRNYEGTGLGLSICKRFTELLGGEIWVESEPGKGSCFSFKLPMQRS